MQTLQKFSKETAKRFSVDDWIGIAEIIFNLFKECRENRLPPQEIKRNIRSGGGLFARLRARRAVKQNLDRTNLTLRQVNAVADYIVDAGLNPAREHDLDHILNEMNEVEEMTQRLVVHDETAADVPATGDDV